MGAEVVGYTGGTGEVTIDTFLLAVLVETGILGTACFFGALLFSIWSGIRRYVLDRSWQASLMGGLASSLAGYVMYRFALAQRENVAFMYILIACIMVLNFFLEGETEKRPRGAQNGDGRRAGRKHRVDAGFEGFGAGGADVRQQRSRPRA